MEHLRKIIREHIRTEVTRIDKDKAIDNVKYWALFATSFYERLFRKITDRKKLLSTYKTTLKKLPKGQQRDALTFFYRIRRDEIDKKLKFEGLSDFVDSSGKTEIWYMNKDYFRIGIHGLDENPNKPDPKNLKRTHVLLGTINEKNLEKIYMKLNSWGSPQVRDLIKKKKLSHTSMSIGDIIKIGNKVYVVDTMGFKKL